MKKEIKAHYNLLKAQVAWDPSTPHEKWMVEDLSAVSDKNLLKRLEDLKVPVSSANLKKYLEEIETPEDFLEAVTLETDGPEKVENVYLILFELFKRHAPKKESLSIFADGLDFLIQKYEVTSGKNWVEIVPYLKQLVHILRENLSGVKNPSEVLEKLSRHFAYDLEGFIYDFIADLIDSSQEVLAEEFIELFFDYLTKPYWFTLLEYYLKGADEERLENLSDLVMEIKDFEFSLEVLHVLKEEESDRFFPLLSHTVDFSKDEADFVELLTVAQEFFEEKDRLREMMEIKKILDSRSQIDEKRRLHPQDAACSHFKKIVERA
ncbi:MAG: hypothetical protein FJZ62_02325 [Chlamydiae bacterium]|nr:hypothetical protein [Chlamydiota bacterium]